MDSPQKLEISDLRIPLWLNPYMSIMFGSWMIGLVFILVNGYYQSFWFINANHNWAFDILFRNFTNLGDSLIMSALLILIFWRKNPPIVLMGIISVTISGLLAQYLKQNIFGDWDRPHKIFDVPYLVHIFSNEIANHNSMPSGHATTAFSSTLVMAFAYQNNKRMQWLLAAIGILICYSRVYVGMHFPGDVLAGAMLGATSGYLILHFFYARFAGWYLRVSDTKEKAFANVAYTIAAVALVAGIWARYFYLFNS